MAGLRCAKASVVRNSVNGTSLCNQPTNSTSSANHQSGRRHGDFATLKQYAPLDATTNPSLILKAALMPEYKTLVDEVIADQRTANVPRSALASQILDSLLVRFGVAILQIVPGRVSTETDATGPSMPPRWWKKAASSSRFTKSTAFRASASHQDRLDLGGTRRGGGAAKGRHPLQHDAALLPGPSGGLRPGESYPHFPLRGPHPRLV